MPPAAGNRSRLPFNPPRRQPSAAGSSKSKPTSTKRKATASTRRQSPTPLFSPEPGQSIDEGSELLSDSSPATSPRRTLVPRSRSPSQSRSRSRSSSPSEHHHNSPIPISDSEPEYILAEITTEADRPRNDPATSEPLISPKLLTTLLHHNFQDEKTRITKDANRLFAKYIDIFIREAVARAVYERKEKLSSDGVERSRVETLLDNYLEVEDLEKLAPQLLLDF